jgi:hypothetical protein
VSNLILEDCFKDIADELDETNEAIMNQVCKSEFSSQFSIKKLLNLQLCATQVFVSAN